jgi:hypothetical protein
MVFWRLGVVAANRSAAAAVSSGSLVLLDIGSVATLGSQMSASLSGSIVRGSFAGAASSATANASINNIAWSGFDTVFMPFKYSSSIITPSGSSLLINLKERNASGLVNDYDYPLMQYSQDVNTFFANNNATARINLGEQTVFTLCAQGGITQMFNVDSTTRRHQFSLENTRSNNTEARGVFGSRHFTASTTGSNTTGLLLHGFDTTPGFNYSLCFYGYKATI